MPRKEQGWITFQASQEEIELRELSHQDTTQNHEMLINITRQQQVVSRGNSKINNI